VSAAAFSVSSSALGFWNGFLMDGSMSSLAFGRK